MDPSTPLVFLHAFPLNATMWEPQRPLFTSRPVITPNFPGFGGRRPGQSDLRAFARSALDDMDRAGFERAVVVGLSMGGYVAFRLLELAPDRVAGLVLADTRAGPDDDVARVRRTEQAARVRREGVAGLADELTPSLLGRSTLSDRPEVESAVRLMIREAEREGVARALEAMRERPDSRPQLQEISAPTLVVVGREDGLTPPEEAQAMAQRVPGALLEVIDEAGHLTNLEAPEAFNAALAAFLA